MIYESFKMAISGMIANKLRTALTLLGVVIGVGAVIAMVSVGYGLQEQVKAKFSGLGSDKLIIFSGGRTSTGAKIASGQGVRLKMEDVEAIKKKVAGISEIAPTVTTSRQVVYKNNNWTTTIQGITPNVVITEDLDINNGSMFTSRDLKSKKRVAVIGQTVIENLFDGEDPIGKVIRIDKAPYRIIGTYAEKGSSGFSDSDDKIYLPFDTAQTRMLGITYIRNINVKVSDESKINEVEENIKTVLRKEHKIKTGDYDDFSIHNMASIMDTAMDVTSKITLFLGIVASISLLVGGIGIMNIMLVSVTERTKEIGIRKALGATYRDILLQFLIESMTIGTIGGAIGVLLGVGGSYAMGSVTKFTPVISVTSIIVAVLFSMAIGVFFGIYPARKAALLNPIDALRYE